MVERRVEGTGVVDSSATLRTRMLLLHRSALSQRESLSGSCTTLPTWRNWHTRQS